MKTIALVKDLIFATRIRAMAQDVGGDVTLVRSTAALRDALAGGPVGRVIIDLNLEGDDALAAVRCVRELSPTSTVTAFISHVQGDLARAAREAGAQEVMARSAFAEGLAGLLQRGAGAEPTARP